MRAITKSAKIHPAAKKCCGWEEPAICHITTLCDVIMTIFILLEGFNCRMSQ